MIEFIIGLVLGLSLGIYFEYMKDIKDIKRAKEKKPIKCSRLELCEIRLRLFILNIYEQKKMHLLVLFWSFIISIVVISIIFVNDSFTAGGGYMDKLIRTLEKIDYSIRQDWGR